ncbi:4Fe-4S ferredoxin [candidate division KSB3 bacterium]|uniref:4Fe-4S ferredoxin n=1 Tax=candidate division KSB3 bacterium TaxID=2044937 RepID=A0A2G6KAA4_9BACT|nr:MAG: 4Fe-4S ferredoxin [candidate division KSB3 bacterium]
MKVTRKIIHIDEALCDGCGQCIPACPEQAIQMIDTPDGPKARLVKELYCDGLGACLGNCPTGALTIEEREADAYDHEATLARLGKTAPEVQTAEMSAKEPTPQGFVCPSVSMLQMDRNKADQPEEAGGATSVMPSQLQQWPVQLHLVPPAAPYFKNADFCIVADCVPFAYGNFHQEFLKGEGRAIAVGCPKLDDTQAYLDKISQIIAVGHPRSITIVNMEVPCCSGLVRLAEQAVQIAGVDVPVTTRTISIKGEKLH